MSHLLFIFFTSIKHRALAILCCHTIKSRQKQQNRQHRSSTTWTWLSITSLPGELSKILDMTIRFVLSKSCRANLWSLLQLVLTHYKLHMKFLKVWLKMCQKKTCYCVVVFTSAQWDCIQIDQWSACHTDRKAFQHIFFPAPRSPFYLSK